MFEPRWGRQAVWLVAVSVLPLTAVGDTLQLSNGRQLEGEYRGGTAEKIKFESNGRVQEIPVRMVSALHFGAVAAAAPVPAGSDAEAPVTVILRVGTRIQVRLDAALKTGETMTGERLTGRLARSVAVGDVVVAPAGTRVFGRVVEAVKGRRIAGKARLSIELTDVATGTRVQPIQTQPVAFEGEGQGTLKKVATGAVIGGIIEGGDGAAKGALIGGAVSVLTKGKQIELPAGAVVEFSLSQALRVTMPSPAQ